jgi:ribosome recycling factor
MATPQKDECVKVIEHLQKDLSTIRTGRAHPSLVEQCLIEAYGSKMPLVQLATITIPDPRTLCIEPWDKNLLHDIERGVQQSALGIMPTVDGTTIRLHLPPMTEERRNEYTKHAKQMGENARIHLRSIREERMRQMKQSEADGEISEDQSRREQKDVQEMIDEFSKEIETMTQKKIQDIQTL